MESPLVRRWTRPQLVRAVVAAVIALVGLVVADEFGDPPDAGLIDKLTTRTERLEVQSGVPRTTNASNIVVGDVIALAGGVIFLLAGIFTVRALTRSAGHAVEQQLGDARGAPLALIISVAGYSILAIAILELVGVDLGGLLLGGAITGVVVGIAAQQTLGNAFAGFVLLIVRPFVVGDHVVLKSGSLGGEYEGRVSDISLFYVDLETGSGPVKLPNAGVLAGAIGPGARSAKSEDAADEAPPHERNEL